MNKNVKRLIIGVLLLTQMGGQAVLADTITEKKSQLQVEEKGYNDVLKEKEEINIAIEKLDVEMEGILRTLDENKQKEEKIKKEIEDKQEEIAKKEEEIEKEKETFSERARGMYITSSSNSFLEMLFDSEGFGDFITKMSAVKKVTDYNNDLIEQMKESQLALEKAKKELVSKEDEVQKLIAQNNESLNEFENQKSEQDKLLAKLQEQENSYASRIRSLEDEIAVMSAPPVTDNNNSGNTSGGNTSGGGNSGSGQDDFVPNPDSSMGQNIVAYAQNFLGVPYVWGGTTPSGFDCSGFTQYVYRHFGINLTRTTYTQKNDGPRVSRGQLVPGDLVFFGDYNSPHHVGIYMGNNQYIHAPRTGDVVKISNMTRSDFVYGVRPF